MKSRRVLSLVLALAFLAGITTAAQQPAAQAPTAGGRTPQEQQDIQALVQLVNEVSAGRQPAPADIAVTWDSNHFVRGQDGSTYVPFNLTVDASKLPAGAAIYTRVMTREQLTAAATPPAAGQAAAPAQVRYPWDNINFTDAVPANGKISRAMALRPGEYEIFMAIKPKGTGGAPAATPAPLQAGLLRRTITVPDFNATGLSTSSIIVATAIEDAPANMTTAQQQENPYVFGPLRIVPSMDGKLKKAGELQVLFWIYGPQQVSGKPNVEVQYNFHQRTPEGDKYFNKTAPQALNGQTLPPEFNMAEGHQLPGSLVVPLGSFPVGDYRLEIIVTDKASGQTKTENVNFTVEA